MKTELLYLKHADLSVTKATVTAVHLNAGSLAVELDRTPFYPQGGGQASDSGLLRDVNGACLTVYDVRNDADGNTIHLLDDVSHVPKIGQMLEAEIDMGRRWWHSRLHAAGELICAVVAEMGFHEWKVASACHFPGQCRVVFDDLGMVNDPIEFSQTLARVLKDEVTAGYEVQYRYAASPEELAAFCPNEAGKSFVGWPVRMVSVAQDFWRPCLGTHVSSVNQIGTIEFRKVSRKKGMLNISYEIS